MCGITIAINRFNTARLNNHLPPTWSTVVISAIIGGVIAAYGVKEYTRFLWPHTWPSKCMPDALIVPPPHVSLLMALVYCTGITCAYHLRWHIGHAALIPMLAAGTLGGVLRVTAVPSAIDVDMLYYGAITGVGFAAVWLIVVLAFDPAFSLKRWHRCHPRARFSSDQLDQPNA